MLARAVVALCIGLMPPFPSFAQQNGIGKDRLLFLLGIAPERSVVGDASAKRFFRKYRDSDVASAFFGTQLCVLEAPASDVTLKVKEVRGRGDTAAVYEQFIPQSAIGVVTGSFFGRSASGEPVPLGLVKADGKKRNKRHPWTGGGIVGGGSRGVVIEPARTFADRADLLNAVQSKPLLVEGGIDGIHSDDQVRFDRSAIALTSDGRVLFLVISEPGGKGASIAEFSTLLLKLKSEGGGSIKTALAMDGGPGAHLYVPSLKQHCGVGIPNYFPNLVYLKP